MFSLASQHGKGALQGMQVFPQGGKTGFFQGKNCHGKNCPEKKFL